MNDPDSETPSHRCMRAIIESVSRVSSIQLSLAVMLEGLKMGFRQQMRDV